MYGSKSSDIAASKVTGSATLSTNKTYQLIRDIDAKQANLGILHTIAHRTGFQNRIPELNVDRTIPKASAWK